MKLKTVKKNKFLFCKRNSLSYAKKVGKAMTLIAFPTNWNMSLTLLLSCKQIDDNQKDYRSHASNKYTP